jgi:hypothetical protein
MLTSLLQKLEKSKAPLQPETTQRQVAGGPARAQAISHSNARFGGWYRVPLRPIPDAGRGTRWSGMCRSYPDDQGLMSSTPMPSKSFSFLVARHAPWVRQIAAICASYPLIGAPRRSRWSTISG